MIAAAQRCWEVAMASSRDLADVLSTRWDNEAAAQERLIERGDFTPIERKVLKAQAITRRACANELRVESRKVARG
jgi:hypothetical protein